MSSLGAAPTSMLIRRGDYQSCWGLEGHVQVLDYVFGAMRKVSINFLYLQSQIYLSLVYSSSQVLLAPQLVCSMMHMPAAAMRPPLCLEVALQIRG
jgi:hypothetical protein